MGRAEVELRKVELRTIHSADNKQTSGRFARKQASNSEENILEERKDSSEGIDSPRIRKTIKFEVQRDREGVSHV
jgi:hypothetical protein